MTECVVIKFLGRQSHSLLTDLACMQQMILTTNVSVIR